MKNFEERERESDTLLIYPSAISVLISFSCNFSNFSRTFTSLYHWVSVV